MKGGTVEKIEHMTPDITQENIERLAELFPSVATEVTGADGNPHAAIDFDALRELLGDVAEGQRERYQFTWPGKREAKQEARRGCNKTLRPIHESSEDWDATQNIYIEGENLEALKLMRETYAGKIKFIYLDPPYNTGHDFLAYNDDFAQESTDYDAVSGEYDDLGNRLFYNTESNGRFHSIWCSNLYQRALLCRDLLCKDGVIAVSIGDRELANVINVFNEIYGATSQVCIFTWKSRAKPTNAGNARFRPQKVGEYVVVYTRGNPEEAIYNVVSAKERTYPHADEQGEYRLTTILTSNRGTFRRETMRFESHGYAPDADYRWKAGKETIDRLFKTGHIEFNDDGVPMEKKYKSEESDPLYPIYCFMDPDITGTAENGKSELNRLVGNHHGFDTVKPIGLLKYLIETFTGKDDYVLDIYSGSGTTGQAVIEQNLEDSGKRKYILIQFPEPFDKQSEAYADGFYTVCDIGRRRMTAYKNAVCGHEDRLFEETDTTETDFGFRSLRIDSSNYRDTFAEPGNQHQATLYDFIDNLKEDRTPEDLLFQVLPSFRIPYSARIEEFEVDGANCFNVNEGQLIACFDTDISTDIIEKIAQERPIYAVFRDASLADDSAAANFEELFKTYSPDTIRRVI